ncbi:leucyl-tRNA synthetase [Malonomonas rubra DSM 5091]|uniref:Leucine--tRNA ligase n=1 Tax=Malonomonas rubra DSM 5091 TaxID=1122189 RepID=A0A1M6DFA9_MALRU|nr:leucine--tRNA ligase [Malonomonas rubra]SHI71791.1 leucyl-tRNA synthetase [Malonomonas rubra DSM 5091]
MEKQYIPKDVERKWQEKWRQDQAFRVTEDPSKEKYYLLEMFPYPSGRIHMGHVRNYAIGDVVARFKRMQGFNVLHPMGWDAFGMPAENAAIENKTHPAKWTYENIDSMRQQLERIGLSYDWQREFATCHPDYYRWEQLVFLKMYEKGLAYKKGSSVNWCPDCATVLANEQVEDGSCWRCHNLVEQKELEQWFFKITDYADELLDWTDKLPGWPERVLAMQRNWIGKSYGCEIEFPVADSEEQVKVFTTRPDTLFGATFMSLAPEHPMAKTLVTAEQKTAVDEFVAKVERQDKIERTSGDLEKLGVFTGSYCINPLNGNKIPVFLANFVLMDYGTGAVMAVPAHDQRDFEFARKYELPITVVIQPEGDELIAEQMEEAYVGPGSLVNSGRFDGVDNESAKEKIAAYLDERSEGRKTVNFRLRDWGVSRQRYWGTPIPVIYCDSCGAVPVPEKDLPVILPDDVELTGEGGSPLARHEEFLKVDCPKCGKAARRESDTFDTFVESSWYFARYACPDYTDGPLDKEAANYWMPVDQYIGGIEHAVMHLLYARFFTKVLRDLGMIDVDEPFTNLLTQGMVCMETQRCAEHGWLYPEQIKDGKCTLCGKTAELGRTEKMSKSKKNVIDPNALIDQYGADTARLFSLFAAPPEKDLEWNEQGVEGCSRFLGRVWRAVLDNMELIGSAEIPSDASGSAADLRRKTHQTIKKVTEDVDGRFHFNTAIAAVMELVNAIYAFKDGEQNPGVLREALEAVVRLLNPFVPHACEELWEVLGHNESIEKAGWPKWDDAALVADEITLVVQVNGKVRGKVEIAVDADKETAEKAALAESNVQRFVEGKQVRKIIVVPGRLINIVVS